MKISSDVVYVLTQRRTRRSLKNNLVDLLCFVYFHQPRSSMVCQISLHNKIFPFFCTRQGPFRDITEVIQQRYKALEPTLRVAEPITRLQEAREELRKDEWMRQLNVNM